MNEYRVTLIYRSDTEDTEEKASAEIERALLRFDPCCEVTIESCVQTRDNS